jgi:hypothetical protein
LGPGETLKFWRLMWYAVTGIARVVVLLFPRCRTG